MRWASEAREHIARRAEWCNARGAVHKTIFHFQDAKKKKKEMSANNKKKRQPREKNILGYMWYYIGDIFFYIMLCTRGAAQNNRLKVSTELIINHNFTHMYVVCM